MEGSCESEECSVITFDGYCPTTYWKFTDQQEQRKYTLHAEVIHLKVPSFQVKKAVEVCDQCVFFLLLPVDVGVRLPGYDNHLRSLLGSGLLAETALSSEHTVF